MAETAVNIVIDKLIPLLNNEVKLLGGVHDEVASVKDDLALIKAYLKDADVKAEMANTSHVVKEWVKQLRVVAFRIEDVIDGYMFKVANRPQRRGVLGILCRTHFISTIIDRHEITSAIDSIKKSIKRLNKKRETFGLNPSAPEAGSDGVSMFTRHDLRLGAHFAEDAELVGVDNTRELLTNWLLKEESRRTVIAVVGEGGLGKTTIVKNVYNKQKEKKSFDSNAWITVSRSLKGEILLKNILKTFYEEDKNNSAAKEISDAVMDKDTLITKLREYLQGRSYMIVFDDIWETDFWAGIEFALPTDNISRIIITTRDKGVAAFCRRSALVHVHELKPLRQNDASKLFLQKAFQSDNEGCPEELMELSQDFVKKCDGVPLAIVAISGLLSTKEKAVLEWQKVYDSLRLKFSSDPNLRSYHQVLLESYYDLPYHLKLCLLYFGLFPEDYQIGRGRLVHLWVAEGFVKENENGDQTLEEIAEEYLHELIRRNLVKVYVRLNGRVSRCWVHDLMHDFILKKCQELNFCQVIKNQEFELCPWTRCISIQANKEDADIGSTGNYGRVRSCLVFVDEELPKSMVKSLFSNFKLLVVLEFENLPLDYLPEAIGILLNLKYLNVRNTKIKTIPPFIGKLQKLETLNLKDTQVRELPVEINRLVKLRHLLSYSYDPYGQSQICEGVKLNEGIGSLTSLQSLAVVDATNGDVVIQELEKLKKIRRLSITNLSRHNGNKLCSAIKNMTHLCSLTIQAANEDEVLELQSLIDPPPFLQRLYLVGRIQRLPEWIPKLKNIVNLLLSWSRLEEDPLPVLKCLSGLLELELYKSYEGDELHFREGWLTKLKFLRLASLPGLSTLKIDKKALPHLEELELGPCPQMVQAPTDIQNLEALKRLFVNEMPRQFVDNIRTQLKENTKLDYYKII